MATDQMRSLAPLIVVTLFGLSLFSFVGAIHAFRKSRTDYYWRQRRVSGQRGSRLVLWSTLLMAASAILCLATGVAGLLTRPPSATPSLTAIAAQPTRIATTTPTIRPIISSTPTPTIALSSVSASPTIYSTVTFTSSPTPFPTSTPTNSPTPTRTPSPTPTLLILVNTITLESSVTPAPNASLKITALDTQTSADCTPINPGDTFKAGFDRIYFFVSFANLQSGVLWRRELLRNEESIQHADYLWGNTTQDGSACFFFGQEGGFTPGQYEIRLFIGDAAEPATSMPFTVK